MGEFTNNTNSELLKMVDNLSQNHEKIKQELIILNETLIQIEADYLEIVIELKRRE